MFYHSRELKHVEYGKVEGYVEEDDWLIPAYNWLGSYCGFYPQIWLSRSNSVITGKRSSRNRILFGFGHIKGFSVDYNRWEIALQSLIDNPNREKDLEERIKKYFKHMNDDDDKEGLKLDDRIFPTSCYEDWRDNYLFVENDQVVLPKLNLKVAKEICVFNEQQRKN